MAKRPPEHEHQWATMTWTRGSSHVHACLVNGCDVVYVGEQRECKSIINPHTEDQSR